MAMRAEATDAAGLARFIEAQAPVYEMALGELRAGRKRSHWMWFVLPQIAGLGASAMSQRYAIADRAEAAAYLAHALLGPRLVACVSAVAAHPEKSAFEIFGAPDDAKFRSCLTLFEAVAAPESVERALFGAALETFCDGRRDPETLRLIGD